MSNSFFSTYVVYILAGKGQKFSVGKKYSWLYIQGLSKRSE